MYPNHKDMERKGDGNEGSFDLTGRVALITGASPVESGTSRQRSSAEHGAEALRPVAGQAAKGGRGDRGSRCQCGIPRHRRLERGRLQGRHRGVRRHVRASRHHGAFPPESRAVSGGLETAFDTDNWRKVLGVNLDGVMFMIKHGWEECAKNDVGAIIPVASLAAWKAGRVQLPIRLPKAPYVRSRHASGKLLAPEAWHEHAVSGLHRDRHDAPEDRMTSSRRLRRASWQRFRWDARARCPTARTRCSSSPRTRPAS